MTNYQPEIKHPTILIMAGGTGGHIFPGLAVAKYLAAKGWQIHWLGTANRMEAELIPKEGFDISFINITGLRNKGLKTLLTAPFYIIASIWQAVVVLRKIQPNVVLGMGGYASAPGGVAAKILGIPLVLHEQNAAAGLTNRWLAKIANITLSAFPNAFDNKVRTQVVGNPLRREIIALEENNPTGQDVKITKDDPCHILVVGGSLGAKILNDTVPAAIAKLTEKTVKVWHQTGRNNLKTVTDTYQKQLLNDENIKITEFIDDMAIAYQWADVVVCRAGALTVSELAMAQKAAVLVPLPHAVDDHQTKNAMYLVKNMAAKLISQKELTSEKLADVLEEMMTTKNMISDMSKAAQKASRRNATIDVAKICQELTQS